MQMVDLTPLEPLSIAKGLRDFYQAAYSTPSHTYTDSDMDEFEERFVHHSKFDGFSILGLQDEGTVIAFTYGFRFPDNLWWRGSVDPEPDEVKGMSLFGLIELAVSENYRSRGLARKLHDALLSSRTEDFATLLARPDSSAYTIYPRWGWRAVGKVQSYPDWPVDDVFLLPLPIDEDAEQFRIRPIEGKPKYAVR